MWKEKTQDLVKKENSKLAKWVEDDVIKKINHQINLPKFQKVCGTYFSLFFVTECTTYCLQKTPFFGRFFLKFSTSYVLHILCSA